MTSASSEALRSEAPPPRGAQVSGLGRRTAPCACTWLGEALGGVHVTRLRPSLPAPHLALTMFPALSSTISSNPTAKMSAGLLPSGGQGRRGRKSDPPGPAFADLRGPRLPVGQVSLCPGAPIQTARQSPTRGSPSRPPSPTRPFPVCILGRVTDLSKPPSLCSVQGTVTATSQGRREVWIRCHT